MMLLSGTALGRVSRLVVCLSISVAALPMRSQSAASANFSAADHPASRIDSARLARNFGKLPISFEPNQGQTDKGVQFVARGAGYTLFLEPDEAFLSLVAQAPSTTDARNSEASRTFSMVGLKLAGANKAARIEGEDKLPGVSNYLVGKDPSRWHTGVPNYGKVRYTDIYPGVDLVYYGNQDGVLEHDFVVKPGADPGAISLVLQYADKVIAGVDGDVTLQTKSGNLQLQKPVAYQRIDGKRKVIPATYAVADGGRVSFHLGAYDQRAPLVIDPVLRYTWAIGGSDSQPSTSFAIAVDSSQNTYVAGITESASFPVDHPYQAGCDCPGGSGAGGSGFITKVNAAGTAFVYSTYFGYPLYQYDPNGKESATSAEVIGIAVDSAQRVYIGGADPGGTGNYVASLNAAGDALLYKTQTSGTVSALALDASNNAYVTGDELNSAYIEKVSSTGVVDYSTSFGNNANGMPTPSAIAVDTTGAVYVTGDARKGSLSPTTGAYQQTCVSDCAFVAKFSPTGQPVYSTFLAGTSTADPVNSQGTAIQVDSAGEAYVAGRALTGFPITANAFQKTGTTGLNYTGANFNGFVTKMNATGSGIVYSTYLNGGANSDTRVYGMALDAHRTSYVTGYTASTAFPQKAPISQKCGGFLTTFNPTLSSLQYYSILVGGRAVAIDKALNAYVTGGVCPATKGELKVGTYPDVTVTKIVIMDDIAVHVSASPSPVAHGSNLTYTLTATSNGPDFGYNVHLDDVLPAGTAFVSDNASGGSCTAPAVGGTGTLHCSLGTLNKGSTWTVTLIVKVNAAAGSTFTNKVTGKSNMQDYTSSNNSATVTTQVN